MLDTLFMKILDMSASGSIVIAVVLVLRLLLKRVPKFWSYVLWVVVMLRLLCPLTLESPVSLVPELEKTEEWYTLSEEPISFLGASEAAYHAVGDALNGGLGIQHIRTEGSDTEGNPRVVSANWWEVWILFGKYVWLVGMALLLLRSLGQYIRLRRRLRTAVRVRDRIWETGRITTPFVLGILRPNIYLPSGLESAEREYILLHEQHHIRRLDPLMKLLAFGALCLHWFNPLVWVAFILAGQDMEMSCDEAVIKKLGPEIRGAYSLTLLRVATGRTRIAGAPLAFGEGDAGRRIRNLAKWRKPVLVAGIAAGILCVLAAVFLLTNPMGPQKTLLGANYPSKGAIFGLAFTPPPTAPYQFALSPGGNLYVQYIENSDWEILGQTEEYPLTREEFLGYCSGLEAHYHLREITQARILRKANQTFYLIFQTRNGDILFAQGWEDVSERNDPYSDDTNVYNLYLLEQAEFSISTQSSEISVEFLREQYPDFLDLPVEDGLDVYIWQMAASSYHCVLLPAQAAEPEDAALLDMPHVGMKTMAAILDIYDLPPEQIRVIPRRMLHSSYLYTIDESYTQSLRYLLGLSNQLPEQMTVDYRASAVRVGWSEDTEQAFWDGVYGSSMALSYFRSFHGRRIESADELHQFLDVYSEILSLDQAFDGKQSFTQVADGYGADFFGEKALLLIYVPTDSAVPPSVQDVRLYQNDLRVTLNPVSQEPGDTVMCGYLLILELSADLLARCNEIIAG